MKIGKNRWKESMNLHRRRQIEQVEWESKVSLKYKITSFLAFKG